MYVIAVIVLNEQLSCWWNL